MNEADILKVLDYSNDGYYCSFVSLGDVYSYLINTRLNVFISDDDNWSVAIERLGFSPRAMNIALEIHYYGNCLINLEYFNNRPTSSYSIHPIDQDNFADTTDGEILKPAAKHWVVRGQEVHLSHNKRDYADVNIVLNEYEPNEICVHEAGRLIVAKDPALFRAADKELYKSIPSKLKKILVLDEWFHKDFNLQIQPVIKEDELRPAYNHVDGTIPGMGKITFEQFVQLVTQQQALSNEWNKEIWENNRPGSYETWQLIAKVIVTKDPSKYKPTVKPNTHWKNWPDSGSM